MLTWDDLAALSLARQLPPRPDSVGAMVAACGPLQTQTARSAFLGLAARFPGVTHAEISAAYDDASLVRGSTIRGTVHTATPTQFTALALATRVGQWRRWSQQLGLTEPQIADLWLSIEEFAGRWRTPDELRAHQQTWLRQHANPEAVALGESHVGRYMPFSHGGLVRRPASRTGWEGQGAPVYRTFNPIAAPTLADVVRVHLSAHGPATRHDLAWWSGLPLTVVDEAVAELADLTAYDGPDGRTYLDVPDPPPPFAESAHLHLLPEFDSLLCAYDPKSRGRFVTPEHHELLWNRRNGLMRPPLLVDGRITGHWRAAGTARRRPLEIGWFARTRRPRRAELDAPIAAVEAALDITITAVTLTRESG